MPYLCGLLQDVRSLSLSVARPHYATLTGISAPPRSYIVPVLIVDDDEPNRTVFKKTLVYCGIKADTATNGQEALTSYLQKRHRLIFMDLNMPVMDGFAATQAIRAHELAQGWSPVTIIAMTAGDTSKEQCLAAGMNAYARKPIMFDEAKTLLRNWAPDLEEET